jgi:hypothetical protein
MLVRWAVALSAGFTLVAATGHAAPQGGVTLVRSQPNPTNLVGPTPVVIDAPAPKDQTLESLVAFQENDIDVDNVDPETECMAKVVQHEAGNQPLEGKLAVAEVIVNRTRSGRFPTTPCAVANQRGQFFQTDAYSVPRESSRWRTAIAIARVAQAGEWTSAAGGALFFHASYAGTGWARHREFVARIADQIFYR